MVRELDPSLESNSAETEQLVAESDVTDWVTVTSVGQAILTPSTNHFAHFLSFIGMKSNDQSITVVKCKIYNVSIWP